jgi:hypothetical protein
MTAESHIVLQLMKMVGDIFDHANVSRDTFSKISNNKIVADLISKDMVFHTIKSDEVEEFFK